MRRAPAATPRCPLPAAALLVAAATRIVCEGADEYSSKGANSEILAESLRRQLMKDNYDYTSSGSRSDEITKKQKIVSKKNHNKEAKRDDHSKRRLKHDLKSIMKSKISTGLMNDESNIEHPNIKQIGDNQKLTVKGMHRRNMQKRKKTMHPKSDIGDAPSRQTDKISYEEDTFFHDIHHTTTVKYKILKVKHGYRRSGKQVMLIQEETPDSVAIVNLGNGPVPQIKLPRTRRQYMHDPLDIGAFGDDDELPPPPVNETFSAEEEVPTTNNETSKTTPAKEPSSDKVQDTSLRSTMTPDEIFVL